MKLDLACGQRKREGYVGVDVVAAEGVDVVHDLTKYPWPFKSDSVEAVFCSHYVEHIPLDVEAYLPLPPRSRKKPVPVKMDGMIAFMNELYRICKDGAKVEIHHPYCKSERAFWDPTHRRFIASQTWYYWNAGWRSGNALDHYPIYCDFEVENIAADGIPPDVMSRDPETQARMIDRSWNVVADLSVLLRAVKNTS